ncbi:hypothetical protein [Pseudomonas sp. HN8-3]|uniref:hypothetical protein n=1 Tax=Pseudomonas sp. HN8-3 TaxID=2886361 RepID=UPI001E3E8F83|nr:hypothetical protein [Pseudomonas sp. HN8-3]UEH09625.1 hypothetical protein LJX92_05870 [Pseudomonas sp. HN8-3]
MAGDYGLSVVNNSGSTVINSSKKILVFSERGAFAIKSRHSDSQGVGIYNFIKPIKTLAPPQIFLRTVSATSSSIILYVVIMYGGAGNWTGVGFTSGAGGIDLQNHNMEIVVCKYSDALPASQYGMVLRDENGAILFSAEDRVVRYSRFTKNWIRTRSTFTDTYSSDITPSADEFICMSQMDRGVNWYAGQSAYATLQIRLNNAPALNMKVQLQNLGDLYGQGTNGTCFSIPVCRFPVDRYYNV